MFPVCIFVFSVFYGHLAKNQKISLEMCVSITVFSVTEQNKCPSIKNWELLSKDNTQCNFMVTQVT